MRFASAFFPHPRRWPTISTGNSSRCWPTATPGCWGRSTRGLWRSLGPLALAALLLGTGYAQNLDDLARACKKTPNARTRAALEQFATAHAKTESGALALLALGSLDLDGRDYTAAQKNLKAAEKRLPKLPDYVAVFRAGAELGLKNFDAAGKQAATAWKAPLDSPLKPRAVQIAARALIDAGNPRQAIQFVKDHYSELPDSKGDLLLAEASEAAQDPAGAVTYYQRVFYLNPASKESADAEAAITRLRTSLGPAFLEARPDVMLARALRLMKAGQTARSKRELEDLAPRLSGPDAELARVRLGVADYYARNNSAGFRYLDSLKAGQGEADAERLYYLHVLARRLDKDAEAIEIAQRLDRLYPQSPWRLEALLSAADHYQLTNEVARYEPLFRECYESFPASSQAYMCHWRALWPAYLERRPSAAALLREHLKRFPNSDKANAALYYLGRSAERVKDFGSARAYYEEIAARFPNSYYNVMGRERLKQNQVLSASAAGSDARAFLSGLSLPRYEKESFEMSAATRLRLERARLLRQAGLDDWADGELRYGAKTDGQPHLIGMELARNAQQKGAPDQAIRYIKAYAPNYLSIPFDSAPPLFWRLAFPLPYRKDLERNSKEQALDPYLVAGLIRQESEFNSKVISHANAYGLTQVVPSTGRALSRQLGVKRFSSNMLLTPSVNLKLGTYYLKQLSTSLNSRWEATLASYNAGKSRVDRWLTWGNYQEPSEFVETIPFNETRTYVQAVLRNADVYRRLYANAGPEVLPADGDYVAGAGSAAAGKPAAKPGARKTPARRRSRG